MSEHDWLADRFEANRAHLRTVAYRMLGSSSEADDAVQEAWLRLSRSDTSGVENLGGWLTTVVARICLDMLRTRKSRREEPLELDSHDAIESAADPEQEAVLADSIGLALLVVLETLTPGERVAFVLHDLFDLPFEEIAGVVGRSPAAARQLASRARRRVQGAAMHRGSDLARQREVVAAFLAASRGGDFGALLALLDPDVMLRSDAAAVRSGSPQLVHGAHDVAGVFVGRARVARLALVDGSVGAVWAPSGKPRVVFTFKISEGTIVEVGILADSARLEHLELTILD